MFRLPSLSYSFLFARNAKTQYSVVRSRRGYDGRPQYTQQRMHFSTLRSCLKIPSGLRTAAKAPVGVGQIHPYRQIWADFPALTAAFSLALGNSPVILKHLLNVIRCAFHLRLLPSQRFPPVHQFPDSLFETPVGGTIIGPASRFSGKWLCATTPSGSSCAY